MGVIDIAYTTFYYVFVVPYILINQRKVWNWNKSLIRKEPNVSNPTIESSKSSGEFKSMVDGTYIQEKNNSKYSMGGFAFSS